MYKEQFTQNLISLSKLFLKWFKEALTRTADYKGNLFNGCRKYKRSSLFYFFLKSFKNTFKNAKYLHFFP